MAATQRSSNNKGIPMKPTQNFFLGMVLCIVGGSVLAQDTSRPTARPSASPEEAIKRFLEECVEIKPGAGEFPGKFELGQAKPKKHERAAYEATFDTDFRISRYEMTQELYLAVTGNNPSRWQGPRNSVEQVTFNDARKFCESLTAMLHRRKLIGSNEAVRLPTAAEWEYCCRAGSSTLYGFGDEPGSDDSTDLLDAHAWHTGNAAGNDPAVGVLKGNAWGLHDMHGYLWEFVDNSHSPDDSPASPDTVEIRSGSWRDQHPLLSCATYLKVARSKSGDHIGFRCVIARNPALKKPPTR